MLLKGKRVVVRIGDQVIEPMAFDYSIEEGVRRRRPRRNRCASKARNRHRADVRKGLVRAAGHHLRWSYPSAVLGAPFYRMLGAPKVRLPRSLRGGRRG